jgi:hypothetical protein
MAYTPQQIIDLVNKGTGPTDMYAGSDKAAQLAALHKEIAEDMLQLQGAMGEHWQGDAAGKAYAGAGPMVQASQVSGDHLTQAQNLYTGQGSSFNDLHGKVAAVGNLGAKPSDDLVSDTPFSFMSNRADEIAAYNQKAQQVVDGYGLYHGQSTDNSGRWRAPSNYGELGMPPAGADIQPATPGTGGGPGTGNPGSSGHNGGPSSHGGSNSSYNGAGGGGPVSGGNHGGGPHSGGPGGSGGQQQGAPGSSGGPAPVHSGASGSGGTSAAGYVPPPPTSGGPGGFGNQPPGGYSSGGFGPGSGGAGSSNFGPGVGGFTGGGFGTVEQAKDRMNSANKALATLGR